MVAYPFTDGHARTVVTIAAISAFFAASLLHALVHRGLWWALGYVVIAGGGALLATAVGLHTGRPFGDYEYDDSLGVTVFGVPVVVPLAMAMFAYPALIAARRIHRPLAPVLGAIALAAWDVFFDPIMVAADHWRWTDVRTSIHGIPGIPLSNFLAWLAVAFVIMLLLDRLPHGTAHDGVPVALFVWTYAACVVAFLLPFDQPAVALLGGIAMGLVAIPLLAVSWARRA